MPAPGSDTELGGSPRAFLPTLWTVVLRARSPDAVERREALGRLIEAYWKPVYFFLRREGRDRESAKDVVQGFFAAFLERDFLQYVRRDRGRFRTFLLTALKHYVADEHDRALALKRGGGRPVLPLDCAQADSEFSREPASAGGVDAFFERQWALRVIERALDALRRKYEADGRAGEFELLRLYLAAGAEPPSYAEVGRRLDISLDNVKNRLHDVRRRYREAILDEVRAYTENEVEAMDELRGLFAALSARPV